jgi:hypothetical protein
MRPNRRIPATARAVALHRPMRMPAFDREWITATVALTLLVAGLLGL